MIGGNGHVGRLVTVGNGGVTRRGKATRVSAKVGHDAVYFESEDLALAPPPELFASALVPAVAQRR